MTEESSYAGEPIYQPPQRLTRAQKLELLMCHPLFTGKCPQCGQEVSKPSESQVWCCLECGWRDATPSESLVLPDHS